MAQSAMRKGKHWKISEALSFQGDVLSWEKGSGTLLPRNELGAKILWKCAAEHGERAVAELLYEDLPGWATLVGSNVAWLWIRAGYDPSDWCIAMLKIVRDNDIPFVTDYYRDAWAKVRGWDCMDYYDGEKIVILSDEEPEDEDDRS